MRVRVRVRRVRYLEGVLGEEGEVRDVIDDLIVDLSTVQSLQPLEKNKYLSLNDLQDQTKRFSTYQHRLVVG